MREMEWTEIFFFKSKTLVEIVGINSIFPNHLDYTIVEVHFSVFAEKCRRFEMWFAKYTKFGLHDF